MRERVCSVSIESVGIGVTLLSVAHLGFDPHMGLIAVVEIALPLAVGASIIVFGQWSPSRLGALTSRQRCLVAGGHLVGGVAAFIFMGWIFVVGSLSGSWPRGAVFTLFLNGGAGGAFVGGVLTAVFLQLRRQREELRTTTDQLQTQNERLERLASVVSHDLRNPLQVAQARLKLAQDANESDHVATAMDALDRIESIISDMLVLTREAQSIQETHPVDLATVARSAWQTVATESTEIDLRIEDSVTLNADEDRLTQAFENLFSNALEHGGESLTTIRIGVLDAEGFYIEDDGAGIPEEVRDEVFDWGATTSPDGTGLGLAIVNEIIEAHGWEIRVVDESADGARFEVTDVGSTE